MSSSRDNSNNRNSTGHNSNSSNSSSRRNNANSSNVRTSTRNSNVRGFGNDHDIARVSNATVPISPPSTSIPTTNFAGLSYRDRADLDSFRVALKELTFNSRPVIEKLTGMAKERIKSIPGPISRTILDNLVFNHPKLKSCFLFLIDSISKNVGDPYPNSFVKHGLVSAYLRVYGEVCAAGDEAQKKDFLRVLPTWHGLFPVEALKEIESKLNIQTQVQEQVHVHVQALQQTTAPPLHKFSNQTLKLLKDLQSVFINPPGPHISGIVSEIFNRLYRGGDLSRDTLDELDSKAKIIDKSHVIEAIRILIDSNVTSSSSSSSKRIETKKDPAVVKIESVASSSQASPFNFELPPNFQLDMSLLSSIVELNKLTSPNSTTTGATDSSISNVTNIATNDKHFVDIPLNSNDLLISRPNLYKLLYDDLGLHCKTCGIRFRDTLKGQERMTAHLDSHFRRNMRLKEKSKRVMARDWFGSESDWILGKCDSSENSSEKTVNIFEESSAEESKIKDEEDSHQYVEATEEEQSSQVKCSICQEVVTITWNDESEQWTFPSCIRNEFNQIVHFNCEMDPEPIKKKLKN